MTPLPPELEALMPEPYDGMPHHEGLGIVDGYTADQMREAIKAAAEWAAKVAEEECGYANCAGNLGAQLASERIATAIRGGGRGG